MGGWSLVSSIPVSRPLLTLGVAGGTLLMLGLCWSFSHTEVKCLPLCLFLSSSEAPIGPKTSQPLRNDILASEAKQRTGSSSRSPGTAPPPDEGKAAGPGSPLRSFSERTPASPPTQTQTNCSPLSLGFSPVKWAGYKGQLPLLPWRPRRLLDLKAIDLSRGLLRILWESGP